MLRVVILFVVQMCFIIVVVLLLETLALMYVKYDCHVCVTCHAKNGWVLIDRSVVIDECRLWVYVGFLSD